MNGFSCLREDEGKAISPARILFAGLAALALALAGLLIWQVMAVRQSRISVDDRGLLERALGSERRQWSGPGTLHVVNCIVLETAWEPDLPQVLDLPLTTMDAQGRFQKSRLEVPPGTSHLGEEIWFERASGRFCRTIKLGVIVIHQLVFDGKQIVEYDVRWGRETRRQALDPAFAFHVDPADLLGLTAGWDVPSAASLPSLRERNHEKLIFDRQVRVFQTTNDADPFAASWQYKIFEEGGSLAGVTCFERGIPIASIYRMRFERLEHAPPQVWDGMAQARSST